MGPSVARVCLLTAGIVSIACQSDASPVWYMNRNALRSDIPGCYALYYHRDRLLG